MRKNLIDGITSLISSITNRRNPAGTNAITLERVTNHELEACYASGIGNKIIRIKTGAALSGTLQFGDSKDKRFYDAVLSDAVMSAVDFQLAFGRSIIVINEIGADLSKPAPSEYNLNKVKFDVFSGDMVVALEVSRNLTDARYQKPKYYQVRGHSFHHSRVIDFTYVRPTELSAPNFQWGGMSEFQLIREQLVSDAIITRSGTAIIEKNASLFYKVKGLKDMMASKNEGTLVEYFTALEDGRSIMGAGLLDSEDDAFVVNQALADYDKVNESSLRRLAMVTGIGMSALVGDPVRGLNSAGDSEKELFNDMIAHLQTRYLLRPINELHRKLGKEPISFNRQQGQSPKARIAFESLVIANAASLNSMGEDHGEYLVKHGVIEPDNFNDMFKEELDGV